MKTFKQFLEEDGEVAPVAVSTAPTNTTNGIAGLKDPGVKILRKKQSSVMTGTPLTRTGYNG